MKKILVYAIPYCYGPTGKALSIASHLADSYCVELAGYDIAYELMQLNNSFPSMDCKSRAFDGVPDSVLMQYDLVISCMDLRLVARAKALGLPSMMFDSLFWWRSMDASLVSNATSYVVQAFWGVDEALSTFPQGFEAIHKVGAVLRSDIDRLRVPRQEHILINYGGVESPYSKGSLYPYIMTDILSSVFTQYPHHEFTVTGHVRYMDTLSKIYSGQKNVRFTTLSHHEFLSCISKSRLVISTPGIETFYESIHMGTPSLLLLPHNSTQYWQLRSLVAAGIESPVCNYDYHDRRLSLTRDEDYRKEASLLFDNLKVVQSSRKLLQAYKNNLSYLMDLRLSSASDDFEQKKQDYLRSIGSLGGESIRRLVREIIGL